MVMIWIEAAAQIDVKRMELVDPLRLEAGFTTKLVRSMFRAFKATLAELQL